MYFCIRNNSSSIELNVLCTNSSFFFFFYLSSNFEKLSHLVRTIQYILALDRTKYSAILDFICSSNHWFISHNNFWQPFGLSTFGCSLPTSLFSFVILFARVSVRLSIKRFVCIRTNYLVCIRTNRMPAIAIGKLSSSIEQHSTKCVAIIIVLLVSLVSPSWKIVFCYYLCSILTIQLKTTYIMATYSHFFLLTKYYKTHEWFTRVQSVYIYEFLQKYHWK